MTRTERTRDRRMPRWGIWQPYWVRVDGTPLLTRRIILICPWFAILYTRIHAPDTGRDPHDHSRTFMSWILTGRYDEDVYTDHNNVDCRWRRQHRRGSVHLMRQEHAHRIIKIRGVVRTVVITGPYRKTATFWTPAGKVTWKDYG